MEGEFTEAMVQLIEEIRENPQGTEEETGVSVETEGAQGWPDHTQQTESTRGGTRGTQGQGTG